MTSPTSILRAAARADGARPRLTWYDLDTGERVELSGASLINWVDKTANFLVDELNLTAGCSVAIDLPRHWTAAVWWLAVDAVGGRALLGSDSSADLAVIGPDILTDLPTNDELVAVSLRPMGGSFATTLPAGVRDFTVEVRSQPDHFSPSSPGDRQLGSLARAQATSWQLTATDRTASAGPWQPDTDPGAALVAPLSAGGSAVWVRNPKPATLVSLIDTEGITAWLGDPPTGLFLPPGIRLLGPHSVS